MKNHFRLLACSTIAAPLLYMAPASADMLTPATEEVLRDLKVSPKVLDGLDEELALPSGVLVQANKEGKVRVRLTMKEEHFEKVRKVFNARYPHIEIDYTRGIGPRRVRRRHLPRLRRRPGRPPAAAPAPGPASRTRHSAWSSRRSCIPSCAPIRPRAASACTSARENVRE